MTCRKVMSSGQASFKLLCLFQAIKSSTVLSACPMAVSACRTKVTISANSSVSSEIEWSKPDLFLSNVICFSIKLCAQLQPPAVPYEHQENDPKILLADCTACSNQQSRLGPTFQWDMDIMKCIGKSAV